MQRLGRQQRLHGRSQPVPHPLGGGACRSRPLQLPPGTRLKLQLTQTEPINAESSPAPRVRVLASSDRALDGLCQAIPRLKRQLHKLEQLERRLQDMPSVPLPVMAEQASL